MTSGVPQRVTHAYVRAGSATLFAAPAAIKIWLVAQPRYRLHITPTRSFCLNLVERPFT
ncbi:hypothetical protein [Streptomyces sp. NPDC051132]|uniref:hypothetical protein n=1 Tax=unclassified Streptomyces TaxID=2593676 RepID=UPI00342D1B92